MQNKEGWRFFIKACLEISNEQSLEAFLSLFLTISEKEDISTRVSIIEELLKQEKPQRQISKDINVSIAKISRGSNYLKQIDPKLKSFLKELF
jgi:TrpR family trp operon transcriptional repressor